jgi:iron complex transport system ATP-binding protein
MLIASGVALQLSGRDILHDIALAARPGAFTAIAGPNGSGKTTLLRAMTGEIAYRGSIRLNGIEIAAGRPAELAAIRAVLAQATEVAFPFTVLEIVRLGLREGAEGQRGDLPARALAAVGLPGYEGRLIHSLSGGEKQRVHLARALAQVWEPVGREGPRWLFLDEPVASLDIGHQLMVMRLARGFADAGGGVVAVMHDLNLTAMVADHLALMAGGRIVAQGRPDEVMTDAVLSAAYGCRLAVNRVPGAGPWLLPQVAGEVAEPLRPAI